MAERSKLTTSRVSEVENQVSQLNVRMERLERNELSNQLETELRVPKFEEYISGGPRRDHEKNVSKRS